APKRPAGMDARVREVGFQGVKDACSNIHKLSRYEQMGRAKKETVAALAAEFPNAEADRKEAFEDPKYETRRPQALKEKTRVDGRDFRTVRPINIEVGLLPRVHGSTLFTRGETQAIVTTTLGTRQDEQRIDGLTEEYWKNFMLHYNFPPYSVGEVKFL